MYEETSHSSGGSAAARQSPSRCNRLYRSRHTFATKAPNHMEIFLQQLISLLFTLVCRALPVFCKHNGRLMPLANEAMYRVLAPRSAAAGRIVPPEKDEYAKLESVVVVYDGARHSDSLHYPS